MVRDVISQICTALEKNGADRDGAQALAVAGKAEAALGRKEVNGPTERHTRKRSNTFWD